MQKHYLDHLTFVLVIPTVILNAVMLCKPQEYEFFYDSGNDFWNSPFSASFVQWCIMLFGSMFHGCQCGMIIIIHFLEIHFSFDHFTLIFSESVQCSCNFNSKGQTNWWFFLQTPRETFRFHSRSITNWSRKLLFSAYYFRFNSLAIVQFDLDRFRNNFWLDHFKCKNSNHIPYTCTQSVLGIDFFYAVTLIFWIMAIIVNNNLLIWIVNIADWFIFKCDWVENVSHCFESKSFCRLRQTDNSIDLFSFHENGFDFEND